MVAVVSENVGVAFSLVIMAGASTAIGASVVFFPSLIKLASREVLAGALGFSGGVMTYVSYIDIFPKAFLAFRDAGHDEKQSFTYASLCFFAGIFIMSILNFLVTYLLHKEESRRKSSKADGSSKAAKTSESSAKTAKTSKGESRPARYHGETIIQDTPCCSKDPNGQLDKLHAMGRDLEQGKLATNKFQRQTTLDDDDDDDMIADSDVEDDFIDNLPIDQEEAEVHVSETTDNESAEEESAEDGNDVKEKKNLIAMGTKTALAIAMHNFPEGMATFVTALADPRVGFVLAFAIAIHNIPEGLCVALPIYYGTGNRWTGFKWAVMSGAAEVVAAFLGWLVLANVFSDALYGTLFGAVAGMMAIISVRELLPTAHFYDPEDKVVTGCYIGGMAIMAASLVLFRY